MVFIRMQVEPVTGLKTFVPWVELANSDRVTERTFWGSGMEPMKASKPKSSRSPVPVEPAPPSQEVRCAVRFPLTLPVVVASGNEQRAATTKDVSASGVLFETDAPLQVGSAIRFSLRMPGAVLGTPHDVLVHCLGRVVRCSISQTQYQAAATIDEYQFAEQ